MDAEIVKVVKQAIPIATKPEKELREANAGDRVS